MVTIKEIVANTLSQNTKRSQQPLLLAISGGLDSMCLLHQCIEAKYKCIVAHVNYQLRNEADGDEQQVKDICEENQIPFYVKKIDTKTFAAENKMGTQEAARVIRYHWFKEIYDQQKCSALVTAHHRDDNIETLLLAMSRGTGLHQLACMTHQDALFGMKICRPFLTLSKELLRELAIKEKINWREDASNEEHYYKRNAIRNLLLPEWRKIFPEIDATLARNLEHWQAMSQWQTKIIEKEIAKICFEKQGNNYISVNAINKHPYGKVLLTEIARKQQATQGQIEEVIHLLQSDSGKKVIVKNNIFYRDRTHIIIAHKNEEVASFVVIEQPGNITIQNQQYEIAILPNSAINTDPNIAQLDADKIRFPLILRQWQDGDYFYPLGLNKKKKVAKYCIDIKMPMPQKNKQLVLLHQQHILWLVGQRIDHRFRITDKTKSIFQITIL